MKLKISNMTGKLEDIQALNSNTLSNAFCKKENQSNNPDKICTICYSFYMILIEQNQLYHQSSKYIIDFLA